MKTERRFMIAILAILVLVVGIGAALLFGGGEKVVPPLHSSDIPPIDGSESTSSGASVIQSEATPTPDPTPEPTPEETTSEHVELPLLYPNPADPMETGPLPTAVNFGGDGESVSLVMGGDVLFHSYLIHGGKQADGSYDYDYAFQYLQSITSEVDIAIANMEGTLAGEPYTGFPLFSAPDAVAKAIRSGGFNVALSSNNHMIDKGAAGLKRTVDILESEGLVVSGTRRSEDEPFYQLVDVGGIRVAMATFTYETIRQEGRRALNAIVIPDEAVGLVNSFSMEEPYMSQDFARMATLAENMRTYGADIVVFNIHWGTEYSVAENWYQSSLAQELADAGVDLILGNGAHVIQPIKEVLSADGDHSMLVYYSVGNMLSDQLYSTADSNGFAEDGLLASVRFKRDAAGAMQIDSFGYIETYCYKVKTGSTETLNTIIPVRRALENPAAYGVENAVNLLQSSLARTTSVMETNAYGSLADRYQPRQ